MEVKRKVSGDEKRLLAGRKIACRQGSFVIALQSLTRGSRMEADGRQMAMRGRRIVGLYKPGQN